MNNAHELIILIAAIVTGAVGVNLVAQILKKLFKLKVDAVIHTMVVAVSFVAAAAQYVLTFKSQFPPEILGVSSAAIYGLSQVTFKYAKYVSGFIAKVSSALDAQDQKATIVAPSAVELQPTEQTANIPSEFPL
jgi:hypothetical protein